MDKDRLEFMPENKVGGEKMPRATRDSGCLCLSWHRWEHETSAPNPTPHQSPKNPGGAERRELITGREEPRLLWALLLTPSSGPGCAHLRPCPDAHREA